jgi:hypothetical protein
MSLVKSTVRTLALVAVGVSALLSVPVAARDASYTVTMNQDSFFGFNPSFNGLVPAGDNVDLSFYGTFWTRPSFGLGGGGGSLWTEFGVGANFNLADGRLKVKPQIGITNGSLLSGGARRVTAGVTERGPAFADGIVPSLTINYSGDKIEAEYYGGYYAALRNRNDTGGLDFLHTWLNVGYKASSTVSFGPHYELLSNTRNPVDGANKSYEWLGGYVQFTLPKGFFARFTAGADLDKDNTGDFYKMSVGMSF